MPGRADPFLAPKKRICPILRPGCVDLSHSAPRLSHSAPRAGAQKRICPILRPGGADLSHSAPRGADVCHQFSVLKFDFRVKGAKSNSRTRQTVANIAGPGRRMGQDRRPGEQQQNKKKSNVEPKPTPGGWGKQNKTKQNKT